MPIPYPNTGMASDTSGGTKKVKISDKEVGIKNESYFKQSSGDEAGSAPKKGVITSKNKGKVYFNSWSMDVKFEGKNAVRHLDLTTNNHAAMPGDTPPWPFIDSMAIDIEGNTDDPCADEKQKEEDDCKGTKPHASGKGLDCDAKCAQAKACRLTRKKDDKGSCCHPSVTGHHLVEVNCFTSPGGRTPNRMPKDIGYASVEYAEGKVMRESLPGFQDYDPEEAPCACASTATGDTDHGAMHAAADRIKRAYKAKRGNDPLWSFGDGPNEQSYWTLDEASAAGAKAHNIVHPQCSEECTKAQLDSYHQDQAGLAPDEPVRSDFSKEYTQGTARLNREGKTGQLNAAWRNVLNR